MILALCSNTDRKTTGLWVNAVYLWINPCRLWWCRDVWACFWKAPKDGTMALQSLQVYELNLFCSQKSSFWIRVSIASCVSPSPLATYSQICCTLILWINKLMSDVDPVPQKIAASSSSAPQHLLIMWRASSRERLVCLPVALCNEWVLA